MTRETFQGTNVEWNRLVAATSNPSFLQTAEWAETKKGSGWSPAPQIWRDEKGKLAAAAMVLARNQKLPLLPYELRVLYVSRGPSLVEWSNQGLRKQVMDDLIKYARSRNAIFIKIDPAVPIGYGEPGGDEEQSDPVGLAFQSELVSAGWSFSADQIQFRNTVWVDLRADEEEILGRMKQKTRYNVRLAGRRGVGIRPAEQQDFDLLYQMYAETAVRDDFVIRDKQYYFRVWGTFLDNGLAEGLIAEVNKEPVGAVMVFRFAKRAWYVYGMSRDVHREKMPNYLLQWEAIRRAKAAGCVAYDLWGAPEIFEKSDSMWGVYRFKRGLGGTVVRTVGAWDFLLKPKLYAAYTSLLPRILAVMRRSGKSRVTQSLD